MFHALDTVSFFGGRGKKTAWGVWKVYTDVTPAFCALAARPTPQTIDTHYVHAIRQASVAKWFISTFVPTPFLAMAAQEPLSVTSSEPA